MRMSKIFSAISSGFSHAVGRFPRMKVRSKGHESDSVFITPYGFFSHPPDGSFAVVLQSCEGSEVKYHISQDVGRLPGELSSGDVTIFNSITNESILLKSSGGIKIIGNTSISGDWSVTGDLSIEGDVNCGGDANITGELECSDAVIGGIRFSTHTHNFVEDNTPGVPKPTLPPNT